MAKTVEITEIKIKIGKKEVCITPEELKTLRVLLNEMFEKNAIREEHHHEYPYTWKPHYSPVTLYFDTTAWETEFKTDTNTLCIGLYHMEQPASYIK